MTDPSLEVLWKNVLDRWTEDAPHQLFLEHCQRTDQLALAASRYRGMSSDRERAEIAQKRLQAVTLLAFARLESARSSREEPAGNLPKLLLLLLLLALSAGAVWLLLSPG